MIFQPQIIGKLLPALTNPGTAADLLSGKQLIDANGNVLTGTMANRGAQSLVLEQGDSYTIPAGYHNGSGVISTRSPVPFWATYNWNDITDPENFTITIPSQYTLISNLPRENGLSITLNGYGRYSTYNRCNVSFGAIPSEYVTYRLDGNIALEDGNYMGTVEYGIAIQGNSIIFELLSTDFTIESLRHLNIFCLVYENS